MESSDLALTSQPAIMRLIVTAMDSSMRSLNISSCNAALVMKASNTTQVEQMASTPRPGPRGGISSSRRRNILRIRVPRILVTSLFATPMFHRSAAGCESMVSRRFWIYRAVTLPLTAVTIVAWLAWTRRQIGLQDLQDVEAGKRVMGDRVEKGSVGREGQEEGRANEYTTGLHSEDIERASACNEILSTTVSDLAQLLLISLKDPGRISLEAWETEFKIRDACLRNSVRVQLLGLTARRKISGKDLHVGNEIISNGAFGMCHHSNVHQDAELLADPEHWDPSLNVDEDAMYKKQVHGHTGVGEREKSASGDVDCEAGGEFRGNGFCGAL